ncbi:MAG TPA: SusC/RagA family TonB-linked outer membrane protein, partial [Gemmatimonadales bacterium]
MLRVLLVASTLLGSTAAMAAAQAGAVAGRITDQANGQPVAGARVQVIGTSLTGQTNAEGRYRFSNVPSGPQTVRVVALGYGAQNKVVDIRANEVVTADFSLLIVAFSLEEFVVTATGEQSRKEVGNAISTISTTELTKTAPVANMGDLLAARAPGVTVLPGNLTGGGSRVRIRGNSSLSLSNNPIYVIDGIRIWDDVNSSSIGIGGTNPSRVNDLNPEEIESIDVIKGPSASTLYGTDAANGVIVIKTKKGKAGKPVWNAYIEQGMIKDLNTYPTNYRAWRSGTTSTTNSLPSNTVQCLLNQVVAGTCVQDSVSKFNIVEDPETTPNGTGHRQQYGVQVSGGGDVARYFFSTEWEDETGYLQMPRFARDRLIASRGILEVPTEQERPNALRKTNIRANISANAGEKFDIAVNTGFISSTQRLPQSDNNVTGLLGNLLGGVGHKSNVVSPGGGKPARANYGYRTYTPDEIFADETSQDINRTMLAATANWRPSSWLSFRGVGGLDYTGREDAEICRRDECTPFTGSFLYLIGFKENNRTSVWTYTGDITANASYDLASNLRARTTVGSQYGKQRFEATYAFAYDIPPGSSTVSAGAVPSAGEATTETATLGFFVEQWFGFRDNLFLTLAVRSDRNNAFGQNFERVYYPKAALSYVLSDETWFPDVAGISSFRLRAAYGASGRQPGPNDAIPFYSPGTASVEGSDTPAIVNSALGNTELKPERSAELELGADISFFSNRLNLELTYFDKNSKDALISRTIPPSLGSAASRFENIGQVNNKGFEGVINAVVLDESEVGWDLTLAASWLSNKVVSLGDTPPLVGTTTQSREGYPIEGWWQRPYTYKDANGDGIIALSEVTVSDTNEFVGYSQPRGEITLFTGFELFDRKLRLQGNIDSKFGSYQLNGTDRIRCESRLNCRGTVDPTAPLWEQARAVAVRQTASRTQYGYMEKIDFLRFREVSATWTMPDRWANLVR